MRVIQDDCLKALQTLPAASVDCCITDPPYPCIKRDYGVWTEEEWWDLMMGVCAEVRRVLKPTGSAVFILQPNSSKLGSMRPWLWRFMLWVCEEWNMVQDIWWWNTSPMPEAHAIQGRLTRPGLKACVWAGKPECYRDQDSVLMCESLKNARRRRLDQFDGRQEFVSGHGRSTKIRQAAVDRGGVTPMNVLPMGSGARWSGGTHGHGAGTPLALMRWWTRYICPPGGTVLDPFAGSGTAGIVALREGRDAILIERKAEYVEIIHRRLAEEQAKTPLFATDESRHS